MKTAMSAQTKEFNLQYPPNSPRRSELFIKYPAIADTVTREVKESSLKAPTADQVAVDIVKAVERRKSPRKIWLGADRVLFKWVVPYLPVWAADAVWSKALSMDMMA